MRGEAPAEPDEQRHAEAPREPGGDILVASVRGEKDGDDHDAGRDARGHHAGDRRLKANGRRGRHRLCHGGKQDGSATRQKPLAASAGDRSSQQPSQAKAQSRPDEDASGERGEDREALPERP